MSDEESATPPASASPDEAPRARRISNPRPKKKTARNEKTAGGSEEPAPQPEAPRQAKFPEFPEPAATPEAAEESAAGGDWPEPEAPSAGEAPQAGGSKRKRRRKKGKGGQNAATVPGESPEPAAEVSSEAPAAQQPSRQPQQPRPKLDAEQLAKCAWKIYLAEVSEEGIALIGDHDARELSRRCFRLAEIFLEEQARRR